LRRPGLARPQRAAEQRHEASHGATGCEPVEIAVVIDEIAGAVGRVPPIVVPGALTLAQLARGHAAVVAACEPRRAAVDQADSAIEAQALDLIRVPKHHCTALGAALSPFEAAFEAIFAAIRPVLASILTIPLAVPSVLATFCTPLPPIPATVLVPELPAFLTTLGATFASLLTTLAPFFASVFATFRAIFATALALGRPKFTPITPSFGPVAATAAILCIPATATISAAPRLFYTIASTAIFSGFRDACRRHRHGQHTGRKEQFTHDTPPT